VGDDSPLFLQHWDGYRGSPKIIILDFTLSVKTMMQLSAYLLRAQAFKYVVNSLTSRSRMGLACLKHTHIAIFSRC
jgi:hypothetical protein